VSDAVGAPVPAFRPPDGDDQHAPPNKEQTDISQPASEKESCDRRRKRRLSSIVDSQPARPSRNLRARLHNTVSQTSSGPPKLDSHADGY
jgi:hypothetical protein